jgi:hypothetical protein
MLLTAFVIAQLAFDVLVVVAAVLCLVRWRARPRPRAEWPPELLPLAREILAAAEAVAEVSARPLPGPPPAPAAAPRAPEPPAPEAGGTPAVRRRVLPGQARLASRIVAARTAMAATDV